MRFNKLFTLLLLLLLALSMGAVQAQDESTVGTLFGDPEGYTLFTPQASNHVYLVDSQGRLINEWTVRANGRDAYLRDNGNLVVTMRPATPIANDYASHIGFVQIDGGFAEYTWDGELVWAYDFDRDGYRIHHGVTLLPNGNIMFIAWEYITVEEAIAAGRNPENLGDGLWPDAIFEYSPELDEIVWEWHVWDHLIQDFDPDAPNYGDPADNPHLIDLNFFEPPQYIEDWQHSNSIGYNAELDQVALNPREFNEMWVIDHSTTTEEASGAAGDLLYRWGNPRAYGRGDVDDKHLFYEHDVQWIPADYPGGGNIILYSNRHELPAETEDGEPTPFSRIVEFTPAMAEDGTYLMGEDGAYLPSEPTWTYDGLPDEPFYSRFASGMERLPDGNTLITASSQTRLLEVTMDGERVWEYIPPLRGNSLIEQGNERRSVVFRAHRYYADMLADYDLTPGLRLEELAATDLDHAVTLEYGGTYNSQHDGDYSRLFYTVSAEANQEISLFVDATDASFAPTFILIHADSGEIVADVAANDNQQARTFNLHVVAGGAYHLAVGNMDANSPVGTFTIQLINEHLPFEDVDETIPRLLYGTAFQNTITPDDTGSVFVFWGNEGEHVSIEVIRVDGTVEPQINLLNANQELITTEYADEDGAAVLDYVVATSGVHYVEIMHNPDTPDNAQGTVDFALLLVEEQ